MNCPNCGEEHNNKSSWYCTKCEHALERLGLETDKDKLDEKYINGVRYEIY